ncbi:MAG: P1 family peptidase [Rubrivivax sp.]|nr:P1 family peptidase [Rubrivivax sp.]
MALPAPPNDHLPEPYPGSLTDVAGLAVGHHTRTDRPTGCTVVLCPQGATCGVDVRGAAPGTRETDLLAPENLVEQVHAVLLTGGSAFGLDAAGGVMRWLETQGHGYLAGPARVPIVPAAVLFDLWLSGTAPRPGADDGWAACEAAGTAPPAQGSVGAGAGATVGKLFGITRAMKGGIGSASLRVGGVTVAALMAVNAFGDVVAADGSVLAGARTADGRALVHSRDAMVAGAWPPPAPAGASAAAPDLPGANTTIGVVATDAALGKAQAKKLAMLAFHGLARAVEPIAATDGDTLFALATGRAAAAAPPLTLLGALGAEVVARAVRNAVLGATAVAGPPALPAARDLRTR